MKRNALTLAVAGAIALSGFAVVQAGAGHGGRWHGHGSGLERLTEKLDLTADQQAKAQPIIEAAKPQIIAIHQEAKEKSKAVMDNAISQIRPLLTAEQQKKLDEIQKAHQDMMKAHKELRDAMED
jgi:Spy/CpxP family protein refolding chaperone